MAREVASRRSIFQPVGEALHDRGVDGFLPLDDAVDDRLEDIGIGFLDRLALVVEAEAVFHEIGDDGARRLFGLLHLVERLHGGQARACAPCGEQLAFGFG